jgi:hypothetical protein
MKYDVALSFAGEDRVIAQRLAEALAARGIRIFFDEYEKARMWGRNLYDFLAEVYLSQRPESRKVPLPLNADAAHRISSVESRSATRRRPG